MKKLLLTFQITLAAVTLFSGCKQNRNTGDKEDAPGNFELYKYFEKQLGQTAKAGGYVNFKVKLDRVQQAAPTGCEVPEEGPTTCYRFRIDRTEYLTGYHETYVSKYTGDEYKLYRDRNGKLNVLDHKAGQTETGERKSGGLY